MAKPTIAALTAYVVLFILSTILALPLLISRIQPDGSFLINGSGDNLWHLSLIVETKKQFPPSFPGINGVMLKNYHYFSDAFWGFISRLFGIPPHIIYFQIGSLTVSLVLVILLYKLGLAITQNRFWSIVVVYSCLFIGSASFAKPLLVSGSAWQGNTFMLDTPYDQMINLHTGIGYILIVSALYAFYLFSQTQKPKHLYFTALSIALLTGFKAFFAIPLLISFGLTAVLNFKKHPKVTVFSLILLTAVSAIIFLSISDRTSVTNSPLEFRPFWILTKMIEDNDRFPLPDLYLRFLHYTEKSSTLRLMQVYLQEFIIYILGNFWIKLFGLFYLIKQIKTGDRFPRFLGLSFLTSVLFSLVIVPNPDPFNAVQFGQVAVIISGLLFALWLKNLRYGIKITSIAIPLLFIIFIADYFNTKRFGEYLIPRDEISALNFLKQKTDIDANIMVDPVFDNAKMKVSGLGERRTFYTGGKIPWLLGLDDTGRKLTQEKYFSTADLEFIHDTNSIFGINYIYTTPDSQLTKKLRSVYLNDTVAILETGVVSK